MSERDAMQRDLKRSLMGDGSQRTKCRSCPDTQPGHLHTAPTLSQHWSSPLSELTAQIVASSEHVMYITESMMNTRCFSFRVEG